MTRKEAFRFFENLVKTGKLEEFYGKSKDQMSREELNFFFYDDGHVAYNPFAGRLTTYGNPTYHGPKVDPEFLMEREVLSDEELSRRGIDDTNYSENI